MENQAYKSIVEHESDQKVNIECQKSSVLGLIANDYTSRIYEMRFERTSVQELKIERTNERTNELLINNDNNIYSLLFTTFIINSKKLHFRDFADAKLG